eukprot:7315122-Heterocapsa_arctica.AAC.1
MLRPRLLRTLLAISSTIKMRPRDVLSHFPCVESDRADSLSLLAISSGSSVESGVDWPFDLALPSSKLHLL